MKVGENLGETHRNCRELVSVISHGRWGEKTPNTKAQDDFHGNQRGAIHPANDYILFDQAGLATRLEILCSEGCRSFVLSGGQGASVHMHEHGTIVLLRHFSPVSCIRTVCNRAGPI